jgi:hypothetical protein
MVLLLPCVANFIPKIIRLGFRVSEVLLGTQRELVWEHIEDNKNLKIQQPQLPKRKKKIGPLKCLLAHLICSQEFLCLLMFFAIYA